MSNEVLLMPALVKTEHLRETLDFTPSYSVEEGIELYVDSHQCLIISISGFEVVYKDNTGVWAFDDCVTASMIMSATSSG